VSDIKKILSAKGGVQSLLDFYSNVLEFDKKLNDYTLAKC
jgi:hypothetical protein